MEEYVYSSRAALLGVSDCTDDVYMYMGVGHAITMYVYVYCTGVNQPLNLVPLSRVIGKGSVHNVI